MTSRSHPVLPEPTRAELVRLGKALLRLDVPAALREALALVESLPPESISRADREIADALGFFYPSHAYERADRYREMRELLDLHPDLARLVLFHRDGRARQAALERLPPPVRSPFELAALAYRLNDWAAPVRDAAEACAARVLPTTDAAIIAPAAEALLTRSRSWTRWGRGSVALDEAFFRPDVLERLCARMIAARTGSLGRVLRAALARPQIDRHLMRLAGGSRLPDLRAIALRCLIEGRAEWRIGDRFEWVDKVFGIGRRVPVTASRPVERFLPVERLIEMAARDRSPAVRVVAADAAVARRADLANLATIEALLAKDSSRRVRERMDFIAKERAT